MSQDAYTPVAVRFSEFQEFGCPYCGYRSVNPVISGRGTAVVVCGECGKQSAAVEEGFTHSSIGINDDFPPVIGHPRRGTPSHGRPDTRPEKGGEYFTSRGIGSEWDLECFCCGGEKTLRPNIAAYVRTREAGERVVAMFETGARLDFRPRTPDYVQVKIGACEQHKYRLEKLSNLTYEADGIITAEMIEEAKNYETPEDTSVT
jgi:hypothetical protein